MVGCGFSGLGVGIKLRRMGVRRFVILERASDLGGTWRDNDYPGLAVDMPSFIYCFPFEMSPRWSRVYAPANEIKAYADACAEKYGVREHIRYECEVVRAAFDEAHARWELTLANGDTLRARYLVNASGLLIEPRMPEIEGIESFGGTLLHSARWDHELPLEGKRVSVIGTGATAVQLIPAIAERVAHLDVYQRTAIWLMGKPDAEISARAQRWLARLPFLQHAARYAINLMVELSMGMGFIRYRRFPWIFDWLEEKLVDSIREQVDDPETQEKLIPDYSFFCKRPSFSNAYYPTFNRANVDLVTDPIERIEPDAIVTRSGQRRPADVIVCATGYSVFDRRSAPTYEILGRGGRSLGAFWEAERFQAYEGATVPGFPNLFLMMGPYSAAGASYFTMIDTQTKHLERCLRRAHRLGATTIEVRPEAHARDFAMVNRRREQTVLFAGDCARSNSYYFDAHGDTPGLRPVTGFEHWWNSRRFPLDDYRFERPAAPASTTSRT